MPRPLPRVLVALLLALWIALPSSAWAQDSAPNLDDIIADTNLDPANQAEPEDTSGLIGASQVDRLNLQMQWRVWKTLVVEGKGGADNLDTYRQSSISMGRTNSPAEAFAAITLIERNHADGTLPTAEALAAYDRVVGLAPDLPYPWLARARFFAREGEIGAAATSFREGVSRSVAWPDTSFPWRFNLIIVALFGVLGAALSYLLVHLVRSFSVTAYEIQRYLPAGITSGQVSVMLIALVLVPGLVLRSPLLSAVTALGLLALTQQPRERVASFVIFGVLAGLPSIESYLTKLLPYADSPATSLLAAQYTGCDERCVAELDARREAEGGDPLLDYTLLLSRYRLGQTEKVIDTTSPDQILKWPDPLRGLGLNVYGASFVALDRSAEAVEHLRAASKALPESAAPALNEMRAHQSLDDTASADAAFDVATTRDNETALAHMALRQRDVNSWLLVENAPLELFEGHLLAADAPEDLAIIARFWPFLAGSRVPFAWALYLGIAGIALACLTLPTTLKAGTSTVCPSCGGPRDPEDGLRNGDHQYCSDCYDTFVAGARLTYHERVANETSLGSRRRGLMFIRRFFSALLPGTGHAMAGYGAFGFTLMFLWVSALGVLARQYGVWRAPQELAPTVWVELGMIAWGTLGLAFLIGLYGAARDIPMADVRTRKYNRAPDADGYGLEKRDPGNTGEFAASRPAEDVRPIEFD